MKYALMSLAISCSLFIGCGSSGGSSDSSENDTDTGSNSANIVINEVVASATDGGNDWIELYVTSGSVDLSSYTLVDDNAERDPQALPQVTLSEGEFLVIQAIDEEDTPPADGYYVTFKLGSDDAVYLYNDGTLVDTLDWEEGEALEGFSYGLFVDGTGSAQTLTPTQGSANIESSEAVEVLSDLIVSEDAPLRINEIVASDSDGGYDWIELYVTGTETVNLSDYSLTDENNLASPLPNVSLSPGDFYKIIATTDELADTDTVNFKLGSSDEVKLFEGDDLIDQIDWKKGQALIGYSYGRFPDGSDATQTLTPSPLSMNEAAIHAGLVISEIVANAENDGYDWFELVNHSEQDIDLNDYQVLDSSDDIDAANLPSITLSPGEYVVIYATSDEISNYYVPFKLGKSDELSLILNDETVDYIEWDASDVVEGYSYGLTDITHDEHSWEKDLLIPTQGSINIEASAFDPSVVSNLYINITTENWADILSNPLDEEYHETEITFNGITLESVAIRTKGGSSLSSVANSSSDRYSFKVDINEYVDGQKFFGLKKFTLQNSFNDPSYMREVIAYNLLSEMGVATPEHAYVNLYVNDELFGLYLMVEAIDGEFVEKHFANDNGDLYKPDGDGSDLTWQGSSISSYSEINLKTNEDTSDQGAFINFVESLDTGSTDLIDVDALLRYMSVSVALSNMDSYHGPLAHNYYIYEQDGVFSFLPWDFNEAFGTFNMGCDRVDIRELYIDEPTSGDLSDKPLIANVFSNSTYLNTYHDYLWQLINGPLESDTFADSVKDIADLIREHVENDPSSFYGSYYFEQNLTSSVSRFYGLTQFMDYRVANMTQQLEGNAASSNNGNGFCQ